MNCRIVSKTKPLLRSVPRVMKSLVAHATVGIVVIAGVFILRSPPLQVMGQSGESVSLSKQIQPTNPMVGDEVTINLTISGSNALCPPQVVTGAPLDVALVIDHSGSMENILDLILGARSKLDNAKEAAKTLIDQLHPEADQVAVVQFDTEAQLVHPLSPRFDDVKRAVDSISGGSSTTLHAGLDRGRRELMGFNHNPRAAPIMIILSDGRSDWSEAFKAAQLAKEAGVRIVSVGIGDDVDTELMIQIASSASDYYFSPKGSDLQDIYLAIAKQIHRAIGATNVRIEHRFDTTKIEAVPDSVSQGGVFLDRGTIVWDIATLHNRSQTLNYRAQVRAYGTFLADAGDDVTYTFCEDHSRSFRVRPSLNLQVPTPPTALTPSVTPMPTGTPTATPTRTPTVTLTPTITPTPASGAIIGWLDRGLGLFTGLWQFGGWFPWLPLILLLLLLSLLILWWLRNRPSSSTPAPRPPSPGHRPLSMPPKRPKKKGMKGEDVTYD